MFSQINNFSFLATGFSGPGNFSRNAPVGGASQYGVPPYAQMGRSGPPGPPTGPPVHGPGILDS